MARRAVYDPDASDGGPDVAQIMADLAASEVCYSPNETTEGVGNIIDDPTRRVYIDGDVSMQLALDAEVGQVIVAWWLPHIKWTVRDMIELLPMFRDALADIVAEDVSRRSWLCWGSLSELTPEDSEAKCQLVAQSVRDEQGQPFIVVEENPNNPRFRRCRSTVGATLDGLNRIAVP